jgi:tetratricopeptide (TPR) repeat protein
MGKFAEAEPLYREALDRGRRVLGDDHPATLFSINNYGYLLASMERLDEAETYYHEALDGFRRTLGDDHPDTLTSIYNMGGLLQSIGRLAEAEAYYREAFDGRRRVLGEDHRDTLGSVYDLGNLLLALGNPDEADSFFEELLEAARESDSRSRKLQGVLDALTAVRINSERYTEAEELARECLTLRADHSPENWRTFNTKSLLGAALAGQEKYDEAEPLLLDGYQGMKVRENEILQKDKSKLADALQRIIKLYEPTGESEKAMHWQERFNDLETLETNAS